MGLNRICVPSIRKDSSAIRCRGLINRESDWKIVGKKLITRVKHDFALFIGARICHPSSKIFVVVHDTSAYGIYRVTLLRWLVQRAANLLADRAHSKDLAPDTLMKLTGHTRYRATWITLNHPPSPLANSVITEKGGYEVLRRGFVEEAKVFGIFSLSLI